MYIHSAYTTIFWGDWGGVGILEYSNILIVFDFGFHLEIVVIPLQK